METKIQKITEVNQGQYEAISQLLLQLYPQKAVLKFNKFKRVVENKNVSVYIAETEGKITGTAQLTFIDKLGGEIWTIEDVVVDENVRGQGIGQQLTKYILEQAKEKEP